MNPSHSISRFIASTYSVSSFCGFVSSMRRLHTPPNFFATPKSIAMAFAWPICRYPLGSGGKRVWSLPPFFPSARSFFTICSMKLSTSFFSSTVSFSFAIDGSLCVSVNEAFCYCFVQQLPACFPPRMCLHWCRSQCRSVILPYL